MKEMLVILFTAILVENYVLGEGVGLGDVQHHHAQDGAVGGDQGQEHVGVLHGLHRYGGEYV